MCETKADSPSSSSQTVRHAVTALDRQRQQLMKLSKDPSKPAFVPPPPQEKTIRAPREMMKNVQGSSAGAGSGEFHVYKAGRRREYERLKLMEEEIQKESEIAEFDRKRQEAEALAEAKTAKNRAKRQKKKQGRKDKGAEKAAGDGSTEAPLKKRRLVDGGKELVFRRPGEESGEESAGEDDPQPLAAVATSGSLPDVSMESAQVAEAPRITIHEDD